MIYPRRGIAAGLARVKIARTRMHSKEIFLVLNHLIADNSPHHFSAALVFSLPISSSRHSATFYDGV